MEFTKKNQLKHFSESNMRRALQNRETVHVIITHLKSSMNEV